MKNNFYLPILKSKLGEFTALGNLTAQQKMEVVPLFEVTPLEWDQVERKVPRTLSEHLDSFCNKVVKKWPYDNCFIDCALLNWDANDNTHWIEYIFDKLVGKGVIPYPITRLRTSTAFQSAFRGALRKHRIHEIGIRVTPNDITSPNFGDELHTLFETFDTTPERSHLIVDLVDANFAEVENISDSILDILEGFPFVKEWKSITVAGTAFPASNRIKEGKSQFPRNDWKFYLALLEKLKKTTFRRPINYGDYSIVNPGYFEFNPKVMKASANIRYTHNDSWIIAKGRALKEAADYLQYPKLARDIFSSGYFLGETFSEGDAHLAKCAKGLEKRSGSPTVWNWVGHNHHFSKVISDLSSMSRVSSNSLLQLFPNP